MPSPSPLPFAAKRQSVRCRRRAFMRRSIRCCRRRDRWTPSSSALRQVFTATEFCRAFAPASTSYARSRSRWTRRYWPKSKPSPSREMFACLVSTIGLIHLNGRACWRSPRQDAWVRFGMLIFACFARVRPFRLRRTTGVATRPSQAAAFSWITAGTISI